MKARRGKREAELSMPDVASASECTGLMPFLPPDEASAERLAELGGVLPPEEGRQEHTKG